MAPSVKTSRLSCGLVRVDRQSDGRWALRVEGILDGMGGESKSPRTKCTPQAPE